MSTSTLSTGDGPQKSKNMKTMKKRRLGVRSEDGEFMENSVIILPQMKDGVVALGDLYDCRTCKPSANIFDKPLERKHLQADPIETMDYKMYRIRDYSDYSNTLKVSASLKVEVAMGANTLSISGSGAYEKTENSKAENETIQLKYDVSTYKVRLMPNCVEQVSQAMLNNISPKDGSQPKIVATHYVDSVILGGNATGEITFTEISDDSHMHIDGAFQMKLPLGGINIEAEAKLEIDNREKNEFIETTVTLQCQPRFKKAPINCQEMMDAIDGIDQQLNSEKHFPQFEEELKPVYGVPVGFRLSPIALLFPEEIELDPTYMVLNQENMEQFTGFVLILQNYCDLSYIRKLMIDEQPKIIPILLDETNPITEKIIEYSKEKKDIAREIKSEVNGLFMEFKFGDKTADDLIGFIKEKEEIFDPADILYEVRGFIKQCRDELNVICTADSNGIVDEFDEPAIRFFSNKQDLDEWYNPSRTIKILLQTNSDDRPTSTLFMRLYDMSPALAKRGIEVGVALPCISEDFSLTFKSRYDDIPQKYMGQDINSMLKIMAVAVDNGESIAKIFYSVNAALIGLQLPLLENFHDIPNMITVMNDYRDTIICETYCELRAKLLETTDTWNFVLPVQALYTSIEMMRFFRRLRKEIPERFPTLRYRFLVGKFNEVNEKLYSPMLVVLYDDILKCICLDHLDILMLMEQLGKEEPNLDLLAFHRIRESCLYTPRADFAISIGQHFSLDHRHTTTDPILPLIEFPDNSETNLLNALSFTTAACLREERTIMSTTAKIAVKSFKDPTASETLLALLNMFGWEDNDFSPSRWLAIDWDDFHKELQQFMSNIAPFLMRVVLAIDGLKNLDVTDEDLNSQIDEIIKFLDETRVARSYIWMGRRVSDEELYKDLQEEVRGYDGLPGTIRRTGIIKACENFVLKVSNNDEFFNVLQMLTFAEGMKTEGVKSLKPFLVPVAKKYCGRIVWSTDDIYRRAPRRLEDSLTEKQLFKTLGVLSEVRFHPILYIVHQELYNIAALPGPTNIKSLLEKLSSNRLKKDVAMLEVIWTNPKFLYALRQVLTNPGVVDTLYLHAVDWSEAIFPDGLRVDENILDVDEVVDDMALGDDIKIVFLPFFPTDIVETIKALIALRNIPKFDWVKDWKDDIQLMVEQLQIFVARHQIPQDFLEVLRNHVDESTVIKSTLMENDCLFYWDDEDKIYYSPWSVATVANVIERLKQYIECHKVTQKSPGINFGPIEVQKVVSEIRDPEPINLNESWLRFVPEGVLYSINWEQFSKLDGLYPTMLLQYDRLNSVANTMLRNVTQQVRMLNAGILLPTTVSEFINYPPSGPRPGHIDFGQGFPIQNLGFLMTRGDIQTCLFNLTDQIVTQHILVSMSKIPIPLPLITTSIKAYTGPENVTKEQVPHLYRMMVQPLQNIIVPELESILPQPRLFMEPFRFILTLRVGDTTPNIGRSTFLNEYLMRDKNMFGSMKDPGAESGFPLNRDGLLEFTWLSEATVDHSFWYNTISPEYKSPTRNMILLGALHGNCFDHVGLFDILLPYVSCFVVFWKVANLNELKKKRIALMGHLGPSAKVLDMIAYPDDTIKKEIHDRNLLYQYPEGAEHTKNREKLQDVISEAVKYSSKNTPQPVKATVLKKQGDSSFFTFPAISSLPKGYKPIATNSLSIEILPPVQTSYSIALLDFIEQHTIVNIHKAIISNDEAFIRKFLNPIIDLMMREQLTASLTHLTYSLDFISRKSMVEAQERLVKLRNEIENDLLSNLDIDEKWLLSVQEECKWSLEQLRWNTLSIQDIFRTLWKYLEESDQWENLRPPLADAYYSAFTAGLPVEMLHPTYSSTPFQFHIDQVLSKVDKTTRIFVVSAIGLKNSGKSYLLNRLFGGCAFTEFSTTFGMLLRLVWLTSDLQTYLDCDAFLIIDTEGVGNPENRIDPHADSLERKLTTYTLGISNISLVPVMGNSLKEMSSILEVVFICNSKLDQTHIKPDIFIVEQTQPGNEARNVVAQEFENSLQAGLKSVAEHEIEAGVRTRSGHQLHKIASRSKHEELIATIRHLDDPDNKQNEYYRQYHQDVQTLYQKILHAAFVSKPKRMQFGDWFDIAKQFWIRLESEPLTEGFNQPSAKATMDNIAFEGRISTVKKNIEEAFRYHEKKAERLFVNGKPDENESLDELFKAYVEGFDLKLSLRLTKVLSEINKAVNTCDDAEGTESGRMSSRRRQKLNTAGTVNPNACTACDAAYNTRESLFAEVVKMKGGFLVEEDINRHTQIIKDAVYEKLRQGLIARQIYERKSDGELQEQYAKIVSDYPDDREQQWSKFLKYVSTLQFVIPSRQLLHEELKEVYKALPHIYTRHQTEGPYELPDLEPMVAFDVAIYNMASESSVNATKPDKMTWLQCDWLMARLEDIPLKMKDDMETVLYLAGMARELQSRIHTTIGQFEQYCGERLLPDFQWEVHFFAIQKFSKFFEQLYIDWSQIEKNGEKTGSNPVLALRAMKDVFMNEEEFGEFFPAPTPSGRSKRRNFRRD